MRGEFYLKQEEIRTLVLNHNLLNSKIESGLKARLTVSQATLALLPIMFKQLHAYLFSIDLLDYVSSCVHLCMHLLLIRI